MRIAQTIAEVIQISEKETQDAIVLTDAELGAVNGAGPKDALLEFLINAADKLSGPSLEEAGKTIRDVFFPPPPPLPPAAPPPEPPPLQVPTTEVPIVIPGNDAVGGELQIFPALVVIGDVAASY